MKKYTCPDCGKVFLNRKPKACPQCGCVSENFIVSELVVQEEGAAQPQVTQPVQQPQYQQQPYQPQYQPQAAPVEVSLEGIVKFLSVLILLAGLAFGLVVIIIGAKEANDWNKIIDLAREASRYGGYDNAIDILGLRHSAAIPVLTGLAIMFLSIIQFVITILLTKAMKRLAAIESKIK